MRTPRRDWRVRVRDDVRQAAGPTPDVPRAIVVVALGLCAGGLATLLAIELAPRAAPLALLVILLSTLLAGRLAPVGPALAHGACAWMALVVASLVTHRVNAAWHSASALWLVLLLVEDMALIGRVGYVRQIIARQRRERGA